MIISRTPYRISFFGGGTDYPSWQRENGGAVLSTTIDKFCYITLRKLPPFFKHRHRIVYSKIEHVRGLEEIEHPAVQGVLRTLEVESHLETGWGLEIHHDGDLPARSGIGSSSSFTVGLLNSVYGLMGQRISKENLAKKAIHVEQDVLKEPVGCQDQIAAAFGGMNEIALHRDGSFTVSPIIMCGERKEKFENNLMLFFTGQVRYSSDIASTVINNFPNRETELRAMQEMVYTATKVFESQDSNLDQIGTLLDEAWKIKKTMSGRVSNPYIDELYEAGKRAGALGGKLLGAGGGGFLLFYVPTDKQESVKECFKGLLHVPFRFENNGSTVVHYDPSY